MAFTAQSALLKFGFILSTVLFFLGLVELGSLAKYGTASSGTCVLYWDGKVNHSSICSFSVIAGGIIAIASGFLFAMDFVTWKKSENYKGKRASLLALFLTPVMCLFSFCTAAVLGLGVKTTCSNIGCNKGYTFEGSAGIYTGITCSSLAGLLFAIYAASEYIQYRRRHINGDKW